MALGWQPIERGEWREQMLFAQPPSLSLGDQCQAGGMGRGEDGGRVAFGKLAGGGGGELGPPRLGSAGTGCRLSTLPSVSLLSPPPFSLFLSPSSTANRTENRVLIPPTPNLCQTPSPPPHNSPHHNHHQAICALSFWLGHLLSLASALIPKRV